MSDLIISWVSPILPGRSLVGIPLGLAEAELERGLARYSIDEEGLLYQFHESPVLKLSRYFDDVEGRSGYVFDLFQSDIISLNKAGTPALSVTLKDGNVFAIKVYDFSFPGESASFFVYKGLLPSGVGLGGKISELLPFTVLEFDRGNEWFITDEGFGLVEVSGWGVPLDERIDQIVTAICIL